jgi:biopolymer transport protein ExbB/TolQ
MTAAVVWTYWLAVYGLVAEGLFFVYLAYAYVHHVARPRAELRRWRERLQSEQQALAKAADRQQAIQQGADAQLPHEQQAIQQGADARSPQEQQAIQEGADARR